MISIETRRHIPFTTFNGAIKSMSREQMSSAECALFDAIFPKFFAEPSGNIDTLKSRVKSLAAKYGVTAKLQFSDTSNPRRFGGLALPRGSYHSVVVSRSSDIDQTLAHELRAYRSAANGLVEVLDLGAGDRVCLHHESSETVFEFEPSILVLIHQPHRLPASCAEIQLTDLGHTATKYYKFPYEVRDESCDKVVDLREPATRDWFFQAFQDTPALSPSDLASDEPPLVALSEFHLEYARRDPPIDFWHMLPTLINPDIGGGVFDTTGSTLHVIASWLQNNGVDGVVYPSARANTSVTVQNGEIVSFTGWNFVDYRGATEHKLLQSDHSPWCWVSFPGGVTANIASNDEHAGSFKISGVVERSSTEHLADVSAIDATNSLLDSSGAIDGASDRRMATLAWLFGWMSVLEGKFRNAEFSESDIGQARQVRRGAALGLGNENCEGRIRELYTDRSAGDFFEILPDIHDAFRKGVNAIQSKSNSENLCAWANLGFYTELTVLIALIADAGGSWPNQDVQRLLGSMDFAIGGILPANLSSDIEEFLAALSQPDRSATPQFTIEHGNRIIKQINQQLGIMR